MVVTIGVHLPAELIEAIDIKAEEGRGEKRCDGPVGFKRENETSEVKTKSLRSISLQHSKTERKRNRHRE